MPEPSQFRHYQIVQDAAGANVELLRDDHQVVVLAFDLHRLELVHCHVLLESPADGAGFEKRCQKLRDEGHPLMARMVEAGDDEGNSFYITANVDGEPLKEYLDRQHELPLWLAVMIACRSLDAVVAVCQRGDFLTSQPTGTLRVTQTSSKSLLVIAGDYEVAHTKARRGRQRPKFGRQASFLRSFFEEHADGNPAGFEHLVPAMDFAELLTGCLDSADQSVVGEMQDLRDELVASVPADAASELPSIQKPRSLASPLLAPYQEVARAVVNLVRIQSQRLDAANPYAMRGTLTKTGRPVSIEQVPPLEVCGRRVLEIDQLVAKLSGRRGYSNLTTVALVHEVEGLTCVAEELVEGVHLGELLRRRSALNGSETYLVLAGLDAALGQIEAAPVPLGKLRLEDVFVLNGRPLSDPKQATLMEAKLTEWPSFSVQLRAHPSLASMTGRGTDPSSLLGSQSAGANEEETPWQGPWLAAVGRFLLGLESVVGLSAEAGVTGREREALEKLLGNEIAKGRSGQASERGDFLARFAKVVQREGAAQIDVEIEPNPMPIGTGPVREGPTRKIIEPDPSFDPSADITPVSEKSSIGFAELLFQAGDEPVGNSGSPIWEATQNNDASPTLPAELLPLREEVPMWLRAAVFIGGSMVLGAIFAHLSGDAIWHKKRAERLAERATTDAVDGKPQPPTSTQPEASPMLPAGPDEEPDRPNVEVSLDTLTQPESVPKAVPVMRAPKSTLRDSLEDSGGS